MRDGIEALLHASGVKQFAIETVCPLMIWTNETGALSMPKLTNLCTAMAARIMKANHGARPVAQDDDRRFADLGRDITPWSGDFGFEPDHDPRLAIDRGEVELIDAGVFIKRLRERVSWQTLIEQPSDTLQIKHGLAPKGTESVYMKTMNMTQRNFEWLHRKKAIASTAFR
jgi:hypothetical protein